MSVLRPFLRKLRKRLFAVFGKDEAPFLWDCRGVIHVGANVGHETQDYEDRGLKVLWIEPIAEVFAKLSERIASLPRQRALQALITDASGQEHNFNIASNDGGSSSIFEFAAHKDIWPDVEFERTVRLSSLSLTDLCKRNSIDMCLYDCLIIDTQGSELLVLKGAEPLLRHFKYIKTEAADFEAYAGCAKVKDIADFLCERGFKESSRYEMASHPDGGAYFELLFKRER